MTIPFIQGKQAAKGKRLEQKCQLKTNTQPNFGLFARPRK